MVDWQYHAAFKVSQFYKKKRFTTPVQWLVYYHKQLWHPLLQKLDAAMNIQGSPDKTSSKMLHEPNKSEIKNEQSLRIKKKILVHSCTCLATLLIPHIIFYTHYTYWHYTQRIKQEINSRNHYLSTACVSIIPKACPNLLCSCWIYEITAAMNTTVNTTLVWFTLVSRWYISLAHSAIYSKLHQCETLSEA